MRLDEKYALEQTWRDSDSRVRELRRREQKALDEKKYTNATLIAYVRIEEQQRRDHLAARLEGLL